MLTTSPTLLERLRAPDQPGAWDRFVALYTPLLLVWARRQGLRDADADDLAQDVLVKLVGLLPTYARGEGQSFRGWLCQVCANQCRDYRRRKATRTLPGADGLSDADAPADDSAFAEAEYRRELLRRGMELLRGDFGESTWAAFHGVMVEARPAAEVAAALGLQVNAVYQATHRVMTRLREELAGLLD